MLSFIFSRYSVSEAVKPSPCGMARVINAYRMLEAVTHGMEGKHIVEIYGDSLIPENNGIYFISDWINAEKLKTMIVSPMQSA